MNPSAGKIVGEPATGSEGSHIVSHPTIASKRDTTNTPPETPRTVTQPSTVSFCDVLGTNTLNANIQARGSSGADAPLNAALTKNSAPIKSISSQDVSKLLYEKKCTTDEIVRGEVAESATCASPARCTTEMHACRDEDVASSPPPSTRLFSDSENESPRSAHIRRSLVSRSLESIPTPRAPMKPARVKSLNTLFPGKTRRRLDFDRL